jgi:hypothetical protein
MFDELRFDCANSSRPWWVRRPTHAADPTMKECPLMARRYDEPVDVQSRDEVMSAFIWRGRLYAVRGVLDQWTERRAWWQDPVGAPRAGERTVWRVEASAGRCAGSGVYDLGLDTDAAATAPTWTLLRVQD